MIKKYSELQLKLIERRKNECFPVINRGLLWYNKLTTEQHIELLNWYNAWLDVTNTLVVPNKPKWIDEKLENEEIIL